MKRTMAHRKLVLNPETIRKVSADTPQGVRGAGSGTMDLRCSGSCTCPNVSVGGVCHTIDASACNRNPCLSENCMIDSINVC